MTDRTDPNVDPDADRQDAAGEAPRTTPGPPAQAAATSLLDLMRVVLEDQRLQPDDKRSLIDELRKNNPGAADRWTHRYAILTLAGAIVLTIGALWALASTQGVAIPDGLVAVGSAAVGGVAGLLSPAAGNRS